MTKMDDTFKEANKDHFELHLRNIINNSFGKDFGALNLNVRFPIVNDIEICEIDIKASLHPLYLELNDKNGNLSKKFYVRSGNSSQELDIEESSSSYIKKRF